jgi:hypothetical protein
MKVAASGLGFPGEPLLFESTLEEREKAIRLLGRYGSRETPPFLLALYERERFLPIKTAIAVALGDIASDPDMRTLRLFSAEIRNATRYSDQTLLAQIARSIGETARFQRQPYFRQGAAKALAELAAKSYLPAAAAVAREEATKLGHR